MLYLRVMNPGVVPHEGYTLLGASTTRHAGVEGTTGQFGSGAKHFIRLCLAQGLNPIVYAGLLRLEFYTDPTRINDGLTETDFEVICCRMTGTDEAGQGFNRTVRTSMTTEFGMQDWTLEMGLREVLTNALDRARREAVAGGAAKDDDSYIDTVKVEVYEKTPRAKAGYTQVFAPYEGKVVDFARTYRKRFLHFGERENLRRIVLPKTDRNLTNRRVAVIFRDGVLVREIEWSDAPSLFDYNFPSARLPIDESRKLDDWTIAHKVGWALMNADAEVAAQVLRAVVDADPLPWEASAINAHSLTPSETNSKDVNDRIRETWGRGWEAAFGAAVACNNAMTGDMLVRKGRVAKRIRSAAFYEVAGRLGSIPTDVEVLTKSERAGRELVEADPTVVAAHEKIWTSLADFALVNGRELPPVKAFTTPMDAGSETRGFYEDGTCALHTDLKGDPRNPALVQTALEELAHHITGAGDACRDFQDYAFRVATACLLRVWELEADRHSASALDSMVVDDADHSSIQAPSSEDEILAADALVEAQAVIAGYSWL
jgi:hypothetical protein